MKIIKNILITLFVIIVLIITTGVIISYFFEDDVNAFFVKEIDKRLATKIDVQKINFSVLSKFPNASVEFSNVVAFSTKDLNKKEFKAHSVDTLFVAQKLFFEFNFIDLLHKKYNIRKIYIKNGKINLAVDSRGRDNYRILKSNNKQKDDFNLNLKEIELSKVRVIYNNRIKRTLFQTYAENLALTGRFSSNNYHLTNKGRLKFEKLIFGKVNYIATNKAYLLLDIDVRNNNFIISKGRLSISDLVFGITGKMKIGDENYINVLVKGNHLSIASLISNLPQKYNYLKREYESKGSFYFESKITGQISKFQSPHIETVFGINNATVLNKKSKIKINKINAKGVFSTGKLNKPISSYLNISEFKAKLNQSNINGTLSFKNFILPSLHLKINADCNLEELQQFLKINKIKQINGNLTTTIEFFDTIKDFDKYSFSNFKNSLTGGNVLLKNINIQLTGSDYIFSKINGKMNFNGNDVDVKQLSFQTSGNKFTFNGHLNNLFSYILEKKQKLFIKGAVYSPNIIIDSLFKADTNSIQGKINFPTDVNFNINLNANKFACNKFNSKKLQVSLKYNDKSLCFSSLSLNTMQGNVSADGVFTQKHNGNFVLTTMADLSSINIRKLFFVFDNFGQEYLKYSNIKGMCNANVNLLSEWKNNFEFVPKTLYVTSSIKIKNGELINFKPAQELSSFAKINELKHINFSTLTNDIMIKDEKVFIPEMNVNSSAFNISFSGSQSFKGDISYKVKLLLSDVLAKKARMSKKENNEFGVIEDNGLGKTSLYFKIVGTTDDYHIKYDTKSVKKKIKKQFKQEKKEFKTILNKEFGLFKKDSLVINNKANKGKKKSSVKPFLIEWDENDTIN